LYEAHQNSRLNARNFFTKGSLRPWRRNEYGGAVGGPLASERLAVDFAVSQTRDYGYINGNALVPCPCPYHPNNPGNERVPLTTDPRTFALVDRMLDAFPDEYPNLPQVSLRHLNTNAIRDIRSTGFSTSLAFRPNATDQLVVEQRFLDSTEEPFEFVVGQNPVTLLRPQSVHLTYSHPFSPQTLLRLSQNFDRLSVFLDATERYKNLLAPLGLDVVPEVSFGHDLTRLGPGASYPRRRVENRFHSQAELSQARGSHALTFGLLVSRLQTNDLQSDTVPPLPSFWRSGTSTAVSGIGSWPTMSTTAFA
ncbi:MAG: carboxypeptidase regulatory-like protein, partial [Acidobacteria bacterium]|nr:carboxypeptidase regulatory-like protein [Acidobacteriota bacterium]